MSTDLTRIRERASKDPRLVFTNLYHHICDVDNLRACYETLKGRKAVGIDGVTKKEYGRDQEVNLADLSQRLKRMGYRPKPKLRKYVPKPGSKKQRPLGISCFEDKLVEASVKRTLEPIYETMFEDSSHGYRPERSPHSCLDVLGRTIQQQKINYVVEADIRGFFDEMMHSWIVKFLEHRIGDRRVIRLIQRMLKAGLMEDGLTRATVEGTPQGSILSPLLSNVYLHYALDLWFQHKVRPACRGEAHHFRYADDFVDCFQHEHDARRYLRQLAARLAKFGLELAEEKTRCIGFGRFARRDARQRGQKPDEFTFLGFTHYCGATAKGYFKVKRRTSHKKFSASLHKFSDWAQAERCKLRKGEMLRAAIRRVNGYLNHYAITDNLPLCDKYSYYARRILFKWLNRKSQRKAYTWQGFNDALKWAGWPQVRRRKDLNPFRRAEAI